MIQNYYPSSDSDGMFYDQLVQTWRREMENQFKALPGTDRFLAVNAAYNLFRETIEAAFKAQPNVRSACLIEIDASMKRISDHKARFEKIKQAS